MRCIRMPKSREVRLSVNGPLAEELRLGLTFRSPTWNAVCVAQHIAPHNQRRGEGPVVAKTYAVRFRCRYGDADKVLILRDRNEALEQIQLTARHFDCPTHGVQLELPAEAKEIMDVLHPETKPMRVVATSTHKDQRRSKRIPLQIHVLVYGRVGKAASFQEETSTQIVTSHGGLLPMTAPVKVGQTLLVVNLATRKEEECRVVSVKPLEGVNKVGLAFLRPAPSFWGLNFPPLTR